MRTFTYQFSPQNSATTQVAQTKIVSVEVDLALLSEWQGCKAHEPSVSTAGEGLWEVYRKIRRNLESRAKSEPELHHYNIGYRHPK